MHLDAISIWQVVFYKSLRRFEATSDVEKLNVQAIFFIRKYRGAIDIEPTQTGMAKHVERYYQILYMVTW